MLLWIILGVVGFIIVVSIIYIIATYNSFVRMKNNIEESFSAMDIAMKKRYDLIPNLVSTIKGYAKHEKETLTAVIQARNSAIKATNIEEKTKAESALSGTLKTLFALAENYPELKSNTNFSDLQTQLQAIETEIANSRRYYNACVKSLNNKVQVFPSNIIAKWFKIEKQKMFELDSEEERKNIKVEF